jgi:hypothetical protein
LVRHFYARVVLPWPCMRTWQFAYVEVLSNSLKHPPLKSLLFFTGSFVDQEYGHRPGCPSWGNAPGFFSQLLAARLFFACAFGHYLHPLLSTRHTMLNNIQVIQLKH